MNEIVISADNFEKEVLKSDLPVLVDFWATWCGPCKMIAPIVEKIANDNVGRIKVCKVNVDEVETLAIKYNVYSIPTVIAFKNGKEIDRSVGYVEESELISLIK